MTLHGQSYEIDKESWPAYRDADDDAIRRLWTEHIGSAAWLAEVLMKMRWNFLYADTPSFITTDNPVVTLHPSLQSKGLRDPDTIVLFPLSPTRVLLMDNHHNEPDGGCYRSADIASLNGLLWREAIEHMFSPRHPNIVCHEMLASAEAMGL